MDGYIHRTIRNIKTLDRSGICRIARKKKKHKLGLIKSVNRPGRELTSYSFTSLQINGQLQ